MPKKAPRNAFFFYMRDLQLEYSENGKMPSMKEMAEIAHPLFKTLPREKKLFYENMAKEAKNVRKGTEDGRLTSDGIPVTQNIAEDKEHAQEGLRMISEVQSFIHENMEEIEDTSIYIVSFNVLVATRECHYFPNEIGLVEYTLRDGIKDSYHCFINPGKIPYGYTSMAKEHSEKTHLIPFIMYDFALAESDHTEIFKNLIKFVKGFKGRRIIFCRDDQLEQTQACYEWLLSVTKDDLYGDNIFFAEVGILLTELFRIKGSGKLPHAALDDMLSSSTYDYALNTRCEFHEDLDSCFCALGFSRKICFIISDNFCQSFNLELTASHLPEIYQNVEKSEDDSLDEAQGISNVNPPDISQLSLINGGEAKNFANANFRNDEEDEDSDLGEFQPVTRPKSQNHKVQSVTLSSKPPKFLYSDLEFPESICGGIGRGRGFIKKK